MLFAWWYRVRVRDASVSVVRTFHTHLRFAVVFATARNYVRHVVENEEVRVKHKFRVILHVLSHDHETLPNR